MGWLCRKNQKNNHHIGGSTKNRHTQMGQMGVSFLRTPFSPNNDIAQEFGKGCFWGLRSKKIKERHRSLATRGQDNSRGSPFSTLRKPEMPRNIQKVKHVGGQPEAFSGSFGFHLEVNQELLLEQNVLISIHMSGPSVLPRAHFLGTQVRR